MKDKNYTQQVLSCQNILETALCSSVKHIHHCEHIPANQIGIFPTGVLFLREGSDISNLKRMDPKYQFKLLS